MRIKLRDIAERANVSLATVSRVINNNSNVDEQTRASVMTVLAQLGYPMTELQLANVNKSEKTIIVVTRSVEGRSGLDSAAEEGEGQPENILPNDFDPLVIDGIETVLRRYGLRTRIERIGLEKPTPTDLAQLRQADGIVIVGGIVGRALVTYLESSNIPFVLAGAHLGDKEINCVLGDYLRSAAQAIASLTELGHRRIAFINGPATTTTSQDKLAGYKLGLCESGLGRDEGLIVTASDFTPLAGFKATQELLSRNRRFSAVLYAGDLMAVGGLRALKEVGLAVPGQVSVIGFYNGAIAQFSDPPLTTINLDRKRVGEVAAQRLMNMLDHNDFESLRIVMPMRLILRASMGRLSED